MAPHLVRARSAYKDIRIRSFYNTRTRACTHSLARAHTHTHTHAHTHTHTHAAYTCITGDGSEKKENDRSVCRREEMGFQFRLKRRE